MNTKNIKIVLIVEDDEVISSALHEEFLEAGFDVLQAFDGEEGLELTRIHKPNLILLDIMMPKKNGFEMLKELKESPLTKNIPVIVLTALGQNDDIKKIINLGAEGYIVKSGKSLAQVLEEVKIFL